MDAPAPGRSRVRRSTSSNGSRRSRRGSSSSRTSCSRRTSAARRGRRGWRWGCSASRRSGPCCSRAQARERRWVACPAVDGYGSASMWGELRACWCGGRSRTTGEPGRRTAGGQLPTSPRRRRSTRPLRACSRRPAPRSSSRSTTRETRRDLHVRPDPRRRDGAVLLHPGKEGRRREPEATVAALERRGRPGRRARSSCR